MFPSSSNDAVNCEDLDTKQIQSLQDNIADANGRRHRRHRRQLVQMEELFSHGSYIKPVQSKFVVCVMQQSARWELGQRTPSR